MNRGEEEQDRCDDEKDLVNGEGQRPPGPGFARLPLWLACLVLIFAAFADLPAAGAGVMAAARRCE